MPADPNDPRLAELHRQRAIVAQHLAWLDTQIAQSSGAIPPPVVTTPAQLLTRTPPQKSPGSKPPISVEAILAQDSSGITAREKWGCIAIVLILGLLILAILFGLPYLFPQLLHATPP